MSDKPQKHPNDKKARKRMNRTWRRTEKQLLAQKFIVPKDRQHFRSKYIPNVKTSPRPLSALAELLPDSSDPFIAALLHPAVAERD